MKQLCKFITPTTLTLLFLCTLSASEKTSHQPVCFSDRIGTIEKEPQFRHSPQTINPRAYLCFPRYYCSKTTTQLKTFFCAICCCLNTAD